MKMKFLMTCLALAGLPFAGSAQTETTTPPASTGAGSTVSPTDQRSNTGKMGTDHNSRNEGRPTGENKGSGTDRHSTNTTDFDTERTNKQPTGRGTIGKPGAGGGTNTKVKEDNGELKIKTEGPDGKRKIEVNRDGTVRVTTDRRGEGKQVQEFPAPEWAASHNYRHDRHVYFPDYYTFYEPGRGYVYWHNGAWQTSATMPEFMGTVDMKSARIQVLSDVDLETQPEAGFPRYRSMYPAQTVNVNVPVPDVK